MNPATAYHQLKNILAKTKLECAAKLAQLWDALKEPTLDQPKPEILLADWLVSAIKNIKSQISSQTRKCLMSGGSISISS